jgi:3-oxoacyl-[acyl-carrier-protein] synthase-1
MKNVYINHLGLICSLGSGPDEVLQGLLEGSVDGMRASETYSPGRSLVCGAVNHELPSLKGYPPRLQSRNNRLLLEALSQIRPAVDAAIARYGKSRVGIVLGTSTSGIGEAEDAFVSLAQNASFPPEFHYGQMEIGMPSEFLAYELDLHGIALTISTACSSSAKALASARRYLDMGLCDAVIAGGADMLCRFTVAGFSALEAISAERCNPMSGNRHGINIGEAAALFLLSRDEGDLQVLGTGETSDAYNISAPEPMGRGAAEAMRLALEDAHCEADAIDYLNLHGTATPHNDAMESHAVGQIMGLSTPCSSTKSLSGHTLGASGALEAAFCCLLLSDKNPQGKLAPHIFDGVRDPLLPVISLVRPGQNLGRPLRRVMSNSFGFGGSNASLILGRTA